MLQIYQVLHMSKTVQKDVKAFYQESILFDGDVLPGSDLDKLANMPSKEEMLSQLISMFQSPVQKFVLTIILVCGPRI